MNRVRPVTLLLLAVAGAAAGWLLEVALTQGGRPALVLPLSFGVVVLVLAVGTIAGAVPVRRVAKGRPGARVDPFVAARVVVLAQAGYLTGAVLSGTTLAFLLFLVTRPVLGEGVLWPSILGVVAAVALVAAGVIAEEMCRIPPADDTKEADDVD